VELYILGNGNKLIIREKEKEKRPSTWTGLQGRLWNTKTLLVVILRGVAHRIYRDNVHVQNVTGFHGACAEVTTYAYKWNMDFPKTISTKVAHTR